MKSLYKNLLPILLSFILINCDNVHNQNINNSPKRGLSPPVPLESRPTSRTVPEDTIIPNVYKEKYFNNQFYSTPSLKLSNNEEAKIITLVNEFETPSLERKKYYYYLLSKEEKVPTLNPNEKKALKVYMDKLFDLELEVVNFNRNAVEVNESVKYLNKTPVNRVSKNNNYKVKRNLATKPSTNNYVGDKKMLAGYIRKIDAFGEIPVNKLPVLSKRMKFIQYRLKNEVVEGAAQVNETKNSIKDLRERKVVRNPIESRVISRKDPVLFNYVKSPTLSKKLLDTIPISIYKPNFDAIDGNLSPNPSDTSKIIMYRIIGEDNRVEPFDFDSPFNHFEHKVAALIHKRHLQEFDVENYKIVGYELLAEKEVGIQGNYYDMCDPIRFGGQPSLSQCTGFAIDQNRIVTANHCMKFDASNSLEDYLWVFDYKMGLDTMFVDKIPKTSVFKPTRLVKNQYFYENDFAMMEVEGEIPQSRIIEDVEINDNIEFGDTLFMIGHPLGLPLKVCSVGLVTDLFADSGYAPYFYCSLDAFEGNSGSPVFLKKNGKCVGFLSAGLSDFETTSVFENSETCASEFIMPFELDRIEELVQKMEDVFLQLLN